MPIVVRHGRESDTNHQLGMLSEMDSNHRNHHLLYPLLSPAGTASKAEIRYMRTGPLIAPQNYSFHDLPLESAGHDALSDTHQSKNVSVAMWCNLPLKYLDLVSAVISAGGFMIGFVYAVTEPYQPVVSLWHTVSVFSNSTQVRSLVSNFSSDLQTLMDCTNPKMVRPSITSMYQDTLSFPIAVHEGSDASQVNLFGLVLPVVLLSSLWQSLRFGAAYLQDRNESLSWFSYNPKAPDSSRWYEYIMTSPFQIVLVAICFHVRESKVLITLAMLQVALVAMGYPIERELQRLASYKSLQNSKSGGGKDNNIDGFDKTSLYTLLIVAWAMHFVIWSSIWAQQLDEARIINSCPTNRDDNDEVLNIPTIVFAIFWTEFVCFLSFGFVNLYTVWAILSTRDMTQDIQDKIWVNTTAGYTLLSVTSKTVLEGLFLAYVVMQNDGIR